MTLNKNDIWKIGSLTVSPFDWLEASYFYYRPSDLAWTGGDNKKGHYLDKGFNVKFSFVPEKWYLPKIALGLDDFAGTGYFSREYLVSTYTINKTKITSGLGWGKFSGQNSFKNPLRYLDEAFEIRPLSSSNYKQGGSPSYDKWFRGEVGIFGGIEHKFSFIKDLKFMVEYDPFDYFDFSGARRQDASRELREKDSNINFGFTMPIRNYGDLGISFIKGNIINLTFSFGQTYNNKTVTKEKIQPKIEKYRQNVKKVDFYEDLLINLNKNSFFLQTANLKESKLDIAVAVPQHRNHIRSASYAGFIANEVAKNHDLELSEYKITHLNAGIELNKIGFLSKHLDNSKKTDIEFVKYYTKLEPGKGQSFLNNEFVPELKLPAIFSTTAPTLINHIGAPEKFYFGGLVIQNSSEILFKRNLILTSELNLMIADNFQPTISGSNSLLPHVRTDIMSYLIEGNRAISRMQLDYIWSPKKQIYSRISGGIFESMYGGIGGEVLYKPFKEDFYIGFESFWVKKRAFNQRFEFLDYSTITSHITFNYLFSQPRIDANISFGKYLAKDVGFTVDLSRTTKDGFTAGIYFTRTNVSAEEFGEGSFDKGFYFEIPFDLFSKEYSGKHTSLRLSPLTRDGGQKLKYSKDLIGLIHNSSFNSLNQQWNGFFNNN